ncbi:hypothetical protein SDC9_189164 [bioreactor metagenome]|uniref:Uncharacterized protein n=1 Tax=bioreactor metagenome TaxID=1076179 RepID=A0A645HRY7_9ZZZZ
MKPLVHLPRPYLDLLDELGRDALATPDLLKIERLPIRVSHNGDGIGRDVRQEGGDQRTGRLVDCLEHQSLGDESLEEGGVRNDRGPRRLGLAESRHETVEALLRP